MKPHRIFFFDLANSIYGCDLNKTVTKVILDHDFWYNENNILCNYDSRHLLEIYLIFSTINLSRVHRIKRPATDLLKHFLEPLSVSTDSFHLSHEWILINDLDLDPRMMKSKLLGARSNRKLELAHTELIHTGSFCLKMSKIKTLEIIKFDVKYGP